MWMLCAQARSCYQQGVTSQGGRGLGPPCILRVLLGRLQCARELQSIATGCQVLPVPMGAAAQPSMVWRDGVC